MRELDIARFDEMMPLLAQAKVRYARAAGFHGIARVAQSGIRARRMPCRWWKGWNHALRPHPKCGGVESIGRDQSAVAMRICAGLASSKLTLFLFPLKERPLGDVLAPRHWRAPKLSEENHFS
jgi:hypothetical protein